MKPYILEQTNWKQIKSQRYEVAVLPWGATEPHNYHLPYGTDSLESAQIAAESAGKAWQKGAKIMVLPTIPLGVQNPGQIQLPFCLHTKPSTQIIIFKDIVEALYGQGIRKLILFNSHGGNDFKPMIREIQPQFPNMLISLIEWFKILDHSVYFENIDDHAGEMETSVIMHYFPELVLPLNQAGEGSARQSKLTGVKDKTAWLPRQWDKVTKDTGVGNPKKASSEKGKRFVDDLTTKISEFFIEMAECDVADLYE